MECLTMVGEKLLDYTLAPIARQVGYLIFCNSNVKELKEKAESLQHVRESVQQRVNAGYRNGDEIYNGVRMWPEKVDEMAMKVEDHIQDDHHKKTGCSSRSFPNFWMRHQLSRKSKKMVQEIEILKNEGQFEQVSYRKAPNLIETLSSAVGDEDFGSRIETLEAIMEALRDPNVNKIGVYGMGGLGKSTLVKQVAQKAQQEFDVVVMATITQNPEVEKIQGQIADMLGLNFSNEQSSIGRAGRLHERFKKEKHILLILDDLWGDLNWGEIGIPSPEEYNNKKISISSEIQQRSCKFLMTSRDRDVLSKFNSQKYFMVRLLSDIEAWKLFKEKAMLDESIGNAELLSIAHEVAQECGGLPLAVVTIASSLKNKEISEWKVVLQELRNPAPTGMQDAIYKPIEVSYQNLKNDLLQTLFLLCGMLAPTDSIEYLFKCSVGLDLFKHIPKLGYARNKFDLCIRKLKDSCLLLDTNNSNEFYKIHDVVRDVALLIASQHGHIFVKRNEILEEWPEEEQMKNCKAIIIEFCDVNGFLERLCCPNLTFLLLENENPSLKLLDNLFEGMPRLKVLDLTGMKFESLPSSISLLSTLRTLCLDHCSLRNIEVIGELKGLKVLSFLKSDFKQLPKELGQLTQLQSLDLTGCSQLKLIPPNTLPSLKKLEELYMEDSFANWDVNDPMDQQQSNASVAELNNLPLLTTLVVHIPDERMLPKVLTFERLQKYKILIGNVWDWSSETETSRILKLWLSTSIHLRDDIKRLLDTVEELHIGKLEGANNVLPSLNNEGLPQLQHLYVTDNDEIQCVINSLEVIHSINLFPNLQSMVLKNVMNLEKLCSGSLTGESFSKLKIIKVKHCFNLRSLLSASLARGLPQLVEIELEECFHMERVVYDNEKAAGILQFPELRSLTIQSLPQLLGFHYEGNVLGTSDALFCEKVMFPSLEKLTINGLDKLNMIWNRLMTEDNSDNSSICDKSFELLKQEEFPELQELWHGQVSAKEFKNLRSVVVDSCEFISNVVPFIVLKALVNLEELEVKNCSNAEVVFLSDGKGIDDKNVILTTKLKKLILSNLPNLKHVWNKDYRTVTFKNLHGVHVLHCERLSYLFPANVAKGMTQLGELLIESCGFEEIVEKDEGQAMFVSFVFPKLTSLVIWNVPQLKWFYPGRHTVEWPALKELEIFIEGEVKVFGTNGQRNLNSSVQQPIFFIEKVFPNLESLRLHDKDDILDWLGQFSIENFRRLNLLQLHRFYKKEDSFPYWLVQTLPNLKNLLVGESYFKEIFSNEGGHTNAHLQLQVLILLQLPKLKYICKEAPFSVSFNELTDLEVSNCDGLSYLVTTSTAKSFVRLETMKIKECWMIKEIVANKPDDETGDEITFSNLKILELQQLSSLISFSSGNYKFKFPSLQTIIVSLCPKLNTFSGGIPNTPKVQRVQVGDQRDGWYWEGNLNATLHKMYINREAYGKIRKEMNESSDDDSSNVNEPALSNTDIDQTEMDKDHHLEDHQELVDIVELLSPSEDTQEETSDLDIPEQ